MIIRSLVVAAGMAVCSNVAFAQDGTGLTAGAPSAIAGSSLRAEWSALRKHRRSAHMKGTRKGAPATRKRASAGPNGA